MSFFKKAMATIGFGAAKVDTYVDNAQIRVGEEFTGMIDITGGSVEQRIDNIYLELKTYYWREYDDTKTKEVVTLHRQDLPGRFTITPGEKKMIRFNFPIPYTTPMTFGEKMVWLETGLDIEMAIDPSDKDYIDVKPHEVVQKILDALQHNLGFKIFHIENKYNKRHSHSHSDVPCVQEFEFRPTSTLRDRLDEVEMIFRFDSHGLEILMEIDRKGRGLKGFFSEIAGTDESHIRCNIPESEFGRSTEEFAKILYDTFIKYIH